MVERMTKHYFCCQWFLGSGIGIILNAKTIDQYQGKLDHTIDIQLAVPGRIGTHPIHEFHTIDG